jgi:hypothetical protein
MRIILAAVLLAALSLVCPATARGQEAIEAAGRKLLAEHGRAIIHISATLKLSLLTETGARAGEQERRVEVVGTLIDPGGLAICSLAALDPTSAISSVRVNVNNQLQTLRLKGELREIKYRLADGTEAPARLVLRDEDNDAAFLAPDTALAAEGTLRLADAVRTVELLEPVIFLGRLGKSLGYESTVSLGRVNARVGRPRTEYIVGGSPGLPAFNREGRLLGIVLTHRQPGSEATVGPTGIQADMTPVLVPAGDLAEAAGMAQAEARKPATRPVTPTEP